MEKAIRNIAFIGTGVMGRSMAGHLMKAGYELTVYNRTKAKAQSLLDQGAHWADTPGEAAVNADVVITVVGYPADVEQVYLGEGGIVDRATSGAVLIDMTTSSPRLAERIAARSAERGLSALDAPVSGGDVGAREARLTIMVGGAAEAFDRVLPVLECMGRNIVHQGPAGAGQHTKMCNQIAIASNMLGVCEAVVYARKAGLDPRRVLNSIEAGAAGSWSLSNLAPRMLDEDWAPGFYVKHFIKDMGIALEAAEEMNLELPGLTLAKRLYEQLSDNGGENHGTQALIQWYYTSGRTK